MGKLTNAAKRGDRLDALKELRNILARQIERTDSDRDLAAMSRQFVQVTAEIDELESAVPAKKTSIEDMRKKLRMVK